MENVFIRLNGRGNAWPVFIGSTHPFYSVKDPDDLGNVSYAIIGTESKDFDIGKIRWELLVDAGNNTASFLIRNENRIPEAILLTHPHMDHSLGVDWIAQSYVHLNNYTKKYPLYATMPCWEELKNSYKQLESIIDFRELVPGVKTTVEEVPGMFVTPFPVYHGNSAFGASLLLFEYHSGERDVISAVITGDMLTPLLRKKDITALSGANVMYVDCNNRFSYPLSNHGSITAIDPRTGKTSDYLTDWKKRLKIEDLFAPHIKEPYNKSVHQYFNEFKNDLKSTENLIFTISDLAKITGIPLIKLVHYGGNEDSIFYNEKILNDAELEKWVNATVVNEKQNYSFKVPKTGDVFKLSH